MYAALLMFYIVPYRQNVYPYPYLYETVGTKLEHSGTVRLPSCLPSITHVGTSTRLLNEKQAHHGG